MAQMNKEVPGISFSELIDAIPFKCTSTLFSEGPMEPSLTSRFLVDRRTVLCSSCAECCSMGTLRGKSGGTMEDDQNRIEACESCRRRLDVYRFAGSCGPI